MPARVIGIGQAAAGDDGVGLVVLEALRHVRLAPGIELHAVAEPSQILSLLDGGDPVVVVDAVLGGTAGDVRRIEPRELAGADVVPVSTHGLGVAQTLALATLLDPSAMPRRLAIVGVCIDRAAPGAHELSAAVAAAVPRAAAEVRRALAG